MIWLFVAHEMVNSEVSFDCDQSSLPEHKRRLPWWDELRIFIEEWLLDEPGSIEVEILIEVGHPLRFVSVEREVRLPDVSHYPATAYSGPMIWWRFLAAADVQRALFSSPSVDRPMCAKQHHT